MRRREFVVSTALAGAGLAASRATAAGRTDARGVKLVPPAEGRIPVAFAISAGTTWIDWVGPQAVFETWHYDAVLKKHAPRFDLFTVGPSLEPVDKLAPDYSYETAPHASVVVVPAQSGSAELHAWLRRIQGTAEVTMSVCTGAAQLAKAGLLDGKRATTHHGAIADFQKRYPAVTWVRGVRFVEGERISTGGGLTAGIDLALRVVERYFGRAEAKAVAAHLEYQGNGWIV